MVIFRAWRHGEAVEAASQFLATRPPRRAAVRRLMKEICSAGPTARKRATDLARLVSAREPGVLSPWAHVLIDLLADLRVGVLTDLRAGADRPDAEWQSCGYLALAAAHNVSTHTQRMRLAQLMRPMLEDDRNALRAIALEVFARLAAAEPQLQDEALAILNEARLSGTPAMRARARGMMSLLRSATTAKGGGNKFARAGVKENGSQSI